MKISNNFGSPRCNPPRAVRIGGVSKPEIAGGTPREEPADGTPRKKTRSGEAAVDCTAAATAIKGGHEVGALEEEGGDINDDEVTSGGRCRPTTLGPAANAADANNVDAASGDDEAASGGCRRPTKAPPASKGDRPSPSHDCCRDCQQGRLVRDRGGNLPRER